MFASMEVPNEYIEKFMRVLRDYRETKPKDSLPTEASVKLLEGLVGMIEKILNNEKIHFSIIRLQSNIRTFIGKIFLLNIFIFCINL